MTSYLQQYQRWLQSGALSPQETAELEAIANDPKAIEDRFFSQLEFGTAGLRGIMGVGLRRMNLHVIRHATQAFAQVILAEGPQAAAQGVAIMIEKKVDMFSSKNIAVIASIMIIGLGGQYQFGGNIPFFGLQVPCIAGAAIFGIALNLLLSIGEKRKKTQE